VPGWRPVSDWMRHSSTLRPSGSRDLRGWTTCVKPRADAAATSPVLRTDLSFSIAAWVRLDSSLLGKEFRLPDGWFATTAISQPGPRPGALTHSPFYLGARAIDEDTPDVVKWCLEATPVDGDPPGPPWPFVWENAFSTQVIDSSAMDQWVFLVGVMDADNREIHLYLPGSNEHGTATLVDHWPFWSADAPLHIGNAYWRNEPVDHWLGSIGPVRVYEGVLTEDDARRLHEEDLAR
jgi:Concanavalin A-like lectin/glucanases superfamily